MQIVYHLGVHMTDEDRLIKGLLRNRTELAKEGIVVPMPRKYRYMFRDLIGRLDGAKANEEVQTLLLDAVMTQDAPKRVVFAHDAFMGLPAQAFGHGQFYPGVAPRVVALRNMFPDTPVTFTFAVRNPATFLQALHALSPAQGYEEFLGGTDPATLRWSEMVERVRAAVPDSPLVIWCNEDLPVIWPQIQKAIAQHAPETQLAGSEDFALELISDEGAERLRAYFADHPPPTEARRRHAVSAFLNRFGLDSALEVEIEFPGWTDDTVARVTAEYEADIDRVATMPGVTVLT